jgi:hypothetical protein
LPVLVSNLRMRIPVSKLETTLVCIKTSLLLEVLLVQFYVLLYGLTLHINVVCLTSWNILQYR